MNKWMDGVNEWVNKRIKEFVNESINELIKYYITLIIKKWRNKWTDKQANQMFLKTAIKNTEQLFLLWSLGKLVHLLNEEKINTFFSERGKVKIVLVMSFGKPQKKINGPLSSMWGGGLRIMDLKQNFWLPLMLLNVPKNCFVRKREKGKGSFFSYLSILFNPLVAGQQQNIS